MEPLRIELDGRRGKLLEPFSVSIRRRVDGFQIGKVTVPAGFATDFASVPRAFWRIIPPWGKYNRAAVVHDWIYSENRFSRKAADWIFLDLMRRLGVSWWKRTVMYRAVRVGGWVTWRRYGR